MNSQSHTDLDLTELRRALSVAQAQVRSIIAEADRPADQASSGHTVARVAYETRRVRDKLFGDHATLFGDPAWDMMLDLYVETGEGRRLTVTSLSIASTQPPTTGLRYISFLEKAGLVERAPHPSDRRATLVVLTAKGLELMDRWSARVEMMIKRD